MNTPEWIEYTGSDDQIEEIKSARSYLVMCIDIGEECSKFISGPFVWVDTSDHIDPRIRAQSDLKEQMEASDVTRYLICQPHQYADLIKIWADTGCPVYIQVTMGSEDGYWLENLLPTTNAPDWNIPGAEYSLTQFED